jgi:insertion element IS1 protein InsB
VAFHRQKKRKSWIWIAIDRYTQEVLGFSVGSRGKKAFKELVRQIEKYSVGHYATDGWKIYKLLSSKKRIVGKKYTTQIERLNANVRHYLSRFSRKIRCYSKCPTMVELSLFLLFFKNLFKCLF